MKTNAGRLLCAVVALVATTMVLAPNVAGAKEEPSPSGDWPRAALLQSDPRSCLYPESELTFYVPIPQLCRSRDLDLTKMEHTSPPSSPSGATGPVGTGPGACVAVPGVSKCSTWSQHSSNPDANNDSCFGEEAPVAMDASASAAFVTGWTCAVSADGTLHADIQTAGYDSVTGEELWIQRFDGPHEWHDVPMGIAVSPDGELVVVTGITEQDTEIPRNLRTGDFVTIAYDAATGEERWISTYTSPDTGKFFEQVDGELRPLNPIDVPAGVTVSDDGERIYVTGTSTTLDPFPTSLDVATISYMASTGQQDWVFRYGRPACAQGVGTDQITLAMGSLGRRIFAGGIVQAPRGLCLSRRYQVVAVEDDRVRHEGRLLWASAHDGRANFPLFGVIGVSKEAIALSGTDSSECASYSSTGLQLGGHVLEYNTVAFDTETGATKWAQRFRADDHLGDVCNESIATGLATSPDGSTFYVTGYVERTTLALKGANDIVPGTIAYDATDGSERWVALERPTPGVIEKAFAVAAAPNGDRVYLAGTTSYQLPFDEASLKSDYSTAALDASDGGLLWRGRYNDSPAVGTTNFDAAYLIGVSPGGCKVFTSGFFARLVQPEANFDFLDFGTLAYDEIPGADARATMLAFTERSADSGQHSDEIQLEVRLTDAACAPVVSAQTTFTLSGEGSERSFTAMTDEQGLASVTVTLTEPPDDYDLRASFAGDGNHDPSQANKTFTIEREDSAAELSIEGKGQNLTLKARLSDLDAPASGISERTIDFFSDSELIGTGVTDPEGVAAVTISPGHRGANRIYEAVFGGDHYYLPASDQQPAKDPKQSDGYGEGSERRSVGGPTFLE